MLDIATLNMLVQDLVLSGGTHTLLLTYKCLSNVKRLLSSKEPARAAATFAIL